MKIIEELKWRGLVANMLGGTSEQLEKEPTRFYVGIDPTADSLHVGHLSALAVAKHLQNHGHKPIILLGGATGMCGDPSLKSDERNLLDEETLQHNQECIKAQISHIIDFDSKAENAAILVNNYDWMKNYSFLNFIRDIGKYLTVNYMMAKDSVKIRLGREGNGLSFTEFSYQLLQGYDFLYLHETMGCNMQIGGSDQWGNITTGNELIRKKLGSEEETFALVWPLITKADGKKFGKSENGNIWLSAERTSPYEFYQFWLNQSDEDAIRYIRIFTTLSKDEIEVLEVEHAENPHLRKLQKTLAKEVTIMIHSQEAYDVAVEASNILFGNATSDVLKKIDEPTLLSVFNGVPTFEVEKSLITNGVKLTDLTVDYTKIFEFKGELRKMIKSGGIYLNKEKVSDSEVVIGKESLLNDKYILIQKGKKSYSLIIIK